MSEVKNTEKIAKKKESGKFSGTVAVSDFRVKGLVYLFGEKYFTDDEGSFKHLINTKRIKK